MWLGVDVGGTFTDAALIAGDGTVHTAKAPTTPEDQSAGVLDAVAGALAQAGATGHDVDFFAHGMTVATNALLEGRGARTAFVATRGFSDLIELARQDRAELYRLCAARPAPLAPRSLRFEADERTGPEGPLRPLTDAAAAGVAEAVAAAGPEAVAVTLLHADRHPGHERRLGAALRTALPGVHVSLSHEVVGTFREYERAATTEIDAAMSPLLARYLERLTGRAARAGLPAPVIMASSGGLIDAAAAARHAALTVLSGPAGGAAGAAWIARSAGFPDAVCFDMGGTSCDVCVVAGGRVEETAGGKVGGRPLALPMLAVHTVGAGGGSIAWRDPGGALRVGPHSAGAVPGPACYRRGGTEPTVTDANLVLGRLDPSRPLAGGVALDAGAAEAAVGRLARALGLELEACADGIVRIAEAAMAGALRLVTVERGIDPRDRALVAFGGAGPLHACALAEALGMATVLVPPASGVLAALGLVISPRRRDAARTVLLRGGAFTDAALRCTTEELSARATGELGAQPAELRVRYELRYAGQGFELPVDGTPETTAAALRAAFADAHAERYGYRDPDGVVELVTVRVSVSLPGAALPAPAGAGGTRPPDAGTPRARPAKAGPALAGPAVVPLPESTLWLPAGWRGEPGADATLVLRRRPA